RDARHRSSHGRGRQLCRQLERPARPRNRSAAL
ncbi:MAG: hypothetical protein AVDCRST_MAG91-3071, partial [uncultured Sphingomonadaceae bacterium]